MKEVVLGFMFFVLTVLSACSNPRMETFEFQPEDPTSSVVDGKNVEAKDLIIHSTIQIRFDDGYAHEKLCTGNILSSTVILTAAHCVTDAKTKLPLPAQNVRVLDQNNQRYEAAEIIVHPLYVFEPSDQKALSADTKPVHGYDLALFKLKKALPDYYRPVQIVTDLQEAFAHSVSVAGYGRHLTTRESSPDGVFRQGPVALNPTDVTFHPTTQPTETPWGITNRPHARMLRFSKTDTTASICPGDSGGPLYFEKDGKIHLVSVNVGTFKKHPQDPNENPFCSRHPADHHISILLGGPHLHFLAESYKALTAEPLPGVNVPEVAKDPKMFEYYFQNNNGAVESPWVSLKSAVAVKMQFKSGNPEKLHIVQKEAGKSICETEPAQKGIIFTYSSQKVLDGNEMHFLTTNALNPEAHSYNTLVSEFEARLIEKDHKLRVIVAAPEGYVVQELPIWQCLYR